MRRIGTILKVLDAGPRGTAESAADFPFSAHQTTALLRIPCLFFFWLMTRRSWPELTFFASPVFLLILLAPIQIFLRYANAPNRLLQSVLFIEYFCVLFLGYYHESLAYAEYLYLPIILCDILLLMERRRMLAVLPLFGILGCTLLSSNFVAARMAQAPFTVLSVSAVCFPFYSFITLALLSFSFARENQKRVFLQLKEKVNVNRKLEEINRNLSQKVFVIKQDAILEERKQITHEIHDTAGYVFVNVIMMLQATLAVLNSKDADKAAEMLENALDYSRRGMNEIRYILQEIRAREEPTLGLQKNFYEIAASFRKATEIPIRLEYGNWPKSFNPKIDTFFLSFFREALTNSLKHGRATEVELICWRTDQEAIITVQDNGAGVSGPIKYGIGISSIKELASSLDGEVLLSSQHGFSITVKIPLESMSRLEQEGLEPRSGAFDDTGIIP